MLENLNINYEKCIVTWNKQWDNICNYLIDNHNPLPKFENLIDDSTFINVINQLLQYKDEFTVTSPAISSYFRGVRENDPSKVIESRFIPDWKFVSDDNPSRMNGSDRLYNYFTISYKECYGEELIYTAAHELRLENNDDFYGCYFNIPNDVGELKFIDLRTIEKIPTNEKRVYSFLKEKCFDPFGNSLSENIVAKWLIQISLSIWEHSKMFEPIDKSSSITLQNQYRPFHVLCDYFERNGFDGVIYRSTVYKKGACLALFDINKAKCDFSSLKQYESSKYMGRKK